MTKRMVEVQIGKFSIVIISIHYYTGIITILRRLANLSVDKREPMLLTQERESTLDIQEYKVNLEVEKQWL